MQTEVSRNGQEIGSYPTDKISELVAAGILKADDYGWQEGMENWLQLSQMFPDLAGKPAMVPPPAPPVVVSDSSPAQPTAHPLAPNALEPQWAAVPWYRRSSTNSWLIAGGFLLFPPLLWWASFNVLTGPIYRKKTNPDGGLATWHPGNKIAAVILLAVQGLAILAQFASSDGIVFGAEHTVGEKVGAYERISIRKLESRSIEAAMEQKKVEVEYVLAGIKIDANYQRMNLWPDPNGPNGVLDVDVIVLTNDALYDQIVDLNLVGYRTQVTVWGTVKLYTDNFDTVYIKPDAFTFKVVR